MFIEKVSPITLGVRLSMKSGFVEIDACCCAVVVGRFAVTADVTISAAKSAKSNSVLLIFLSFSYVRFLRGVIVSINRLIYLVKMRLRLVFRRVMEYCGRVPSCFYGWEKKVLNTEE